MLRVLQLGYQIISNYSIEHTVIYSVTHTLFVCRMLTVDSALLYRVMSLCSERSRIMPTMADRKRVMSTELIRLNH